MELVERSGVGQSGMERNGGNGKEWSGEERMGRSGMRLDEME